MNKDNYKIIKTIIKINILCIQSCINIINKIYNYKIIKTNNKDNYKIIKTIIKINIKSCINIINKIYNYKLKKQSS